MQNVYLQYYFLFLFSLALLCAIGHFTLGFFNLQLPVFNSLFIKLLAGIILLSIGAAVWFTKGKTFLIGSFIPIIYIFVNLARKNKFLFTHFKKPPFLFDKAMLVQTGLLLFFSTLIYLFNVFLVYHPVIPLGNAQHSDNIFYAELSNTLPAFGIESYFPEYIFPDTNLPSIYHYLDLWLNAILTRFCNSVSLLNLMLVTNTVGAVCVWLGYCALLEKIKKEGLIFIDLLLCGGMVFLTGLVVTDYISLDFIPKTSASILSKNVFNRPKLFVIHSFLQLSILLLFFRKYDYAYCSLILLSVAYTTVMPVIGIFVAILLVVQFFYIRKGEKFFSQSFIWEYFSCFFLIFYNDFLFTDKTYLNIERSFSKSYLWLLVKIFLSIAVATFFAYIYCLPVLITLWRQKKSEDMREIALLLFAAAVLCFISLTLRVGLDHMPEAWQIFSNISNPSLNVISVILILYLIYRVDMSFFKLISLVCTGLAITLNIVNVCKNKISPKYSEEYIVATATAFENINPLGVFFVAPEEYMSKYNSIVIQNPFIRLFASHLTTLNSNAHQVGLSVFDIPLHKDSFYFNSEKSLIESSTFYKYVQYKKKNKIFKSIEDYQIDFICEYNVRYVVLSSQAKLPDKLHEEISKVYHDKISGEKLIILK